MLKCFVCGRISEDLHYENVETCRVPKSKKPLKSVLLHLAKFMKNELHISGDSNVCEGCYKELVEYDEFVLKLLAVQQRLTQMIENSQNGNDTANKKSETDEKKFECEFPELSDDISQIEVPTDGEEDDISIPDIDIKEEFEDGLELSDLEVPPTPVSPTSLKIISCSQCNRIFKNKTRLLYHMEHEHKKRKPCVCKICGHAVRDEEYLDLHMNLHEGKTEKECRYCSKRYTRKVNVIRHMQKHWDKKKFQCEKCGLRFSETTVLYNHKLQHEAEEQPLVCNVCNQTFKTKRTYKGHMMTHREDRPRYGCTYCAKTFVEKYTLKVHLRTHEDQSTQTPKSENKEKPNIPIVSEEMKFSHTCIICGSGFSNKDQHNQHMETMHDVILKI